MQQVIIQAEEAGQRFDKFLKKYLPQAPGSVLYKMLRKKNITLNGKKADGSEKLKPGDCASLFFAEETFAKFRGDTGTPDAAGKGLIQQAQTAFRKFGSLPVLYEDSHILLVDKPAGILSQKAGAEDVSLNEWLIGYLLKQGAVTARSFSMFRPSVCNRLDRNTSGIVICGKSLYGSQQMSRMLKERSLHKYYLLYVEGQMEQPRRIEGYLRKDQNSNKVEIFRKEQPDSARIITSYRPVSIGTCETLVEVELVTGKPHQIRAHLASIGFPLVGDGKYGNPVLNEKRRRQGIHHQLLHAYRLVFPEMTGELAALSGREIKAPLPELFQKISR